MWYAGVRDVGPAPRLDLELGERLNVLTGDHGLGKSFPLERAGWMSCAGVGRWSFNAKTRRRKDAKRRE